ncbi:hypothetical protein LLH23_09700 [bacterium]|nr:hypothetical protein [bacterium]
MARGPARLLTADTLWPLAVLACLFAFVATCPIRPQDFWWHLKVGQEIVQTHRIPQVDTFSYTMPGAPYPSYNVYWLADVALYRIHALGGPALSLFAHALLITGTYLLLCLVCLRLAGNARMATAALVAAAALGFENWNLRPQALSLLLFTLTLGLVYAFRTGARTSRWRLAAFPALMLLWVNCHGSFALQIVMLAVWLVETVWERCRIGPRSRREVWAPAVALVLSAGAMLLNPQGAGIFAYLGEMAANPAVRQLQEWAPASLATRDGIAFWVLAPLGLVLLLWAGRARSGLFHWLMLIAFGLLAWRTGRAIVWFGLVVAPIIAELLPRVLERRGPCRAAHDALPPGERVVLAVLMLCFATLMVVSLPWFKDRLPFPAQKAGLISAETPVAATSFLLQHHLPPQVFHSADDGSYLIWAATPQVRVFADPRIELYPARVWDAYHALSRGDAGWQRTLDAYGVNTLLLSRRQQPGLVAAAAASADWQQVYADSTSVIYVRRGTRP